MKKFAIFTLILLLAGFASVVSADDYLVFDPDETPLTGPWVDTTLSNAGYTGTYVTALADAGDLENYDLIFICLGIFSNNYELTEAEAAPLATFLDNGGMIYMEGGDTWYYDDPTSLHPYFNITGDADGSSDVDGLDGVAGTFTEGYSSTYSGENNWMDRLSPAGDAYTVFTNPDTGFNHGIANDTDTYKTLGCSFELAGLDTDPDMMLMTIVEDFFEVFPYFGGIAGNVTLEGTTDYEGVMVEATSADFSRSAMTDANGDYVVNALAPGTYDVTAYKLGWQMGTVEGVTVADDIVTGIDFDLMLVGLPPQNLTASDDLLNSVMVSWDESSGATGYNVYRSDVSGGPYTMIGNTTDLSFEDTNVGTDQWFYVATAIYPDGESDFSNEDEGSVDLPPSAPDSVWVDMDGSMVTINWTPSPEDDVTRYLVYHLVFGMEEYALLANVDDGSTSFVHDPAPEGFNNYYITAVDAPPSLESEPSMSVQAVVGNIPPLALYAESGLDGNVPLMWIPPVAGDAPGGGLIDFEDDNGDFVADNGSVGPDEGWEWGVPTYGPGAAYSGENVWAINLDGDYNNNSTDYKLHSPEMNVPNNDDVYLTYWVWHDTEGCFSTAWDGFNVKISIDGGSTWTVLQPMIPPEYPRTGASSNPAIGGEGAFSCTSGEGEPDPAVWTQHVFSLADYAGETAIFRWHFGSDSSVNGYPGVYLDDVMIGDYDTAREQRAAVGYNIYRGTEPGLFPDLVASVDSLTTEYTDWGPDGMGLDNDTYYYYCVTADYGDDGESNCAVATAMPMNWPPPTPENLAASIEDRMVDLTWDAVDVYDLVGYNIYRAQGYEGTFELVNTDGPVMDNMYTDDMTDAIDDVYLYYVTAHDADGADSEPSDQVQVLVGNVPPSNLEAEGGMDGYVPLSWVPPGLPGGEEGVIFWDTGNEADDSIGLTAGGTFQVAARFDVMDIEPYVNSYLTQVEVWFADANATYNLKIWEGGSLGDPGELIYTQPIDNFEVDTWTMVEMDEAVQIQADNEYWIGYDVTHNAGTFPAGCTTPMTPDKGGWIQFDTNPWEQIGDLGLDYNWIIHGYLFPFPTASGVSNFVTISNDDTDQTAGYALHDVNGSGLSVNLSADFTDFMMDNYGEISMDLMAKAKDGYQSVAKRTGFYVDLNATVRETRDLMGFNIYRDTSPDVVPGTATFVETLPADSLEYVDWGPDLDNLPDGLEEGLANGTDYYFVVTADYGTDGESPASNEVMATPTNAPPADPTNLAFIDEDRVITLFWDDNTDYDLMEYNVYRRTADTDYQLIGSTDEATYEDDLSGADDALYYYQVSAVDYYNAESVGFTNEVQVPIGRIPPTEVTATSSQTGEYIRVAWMHPLGGGGGEEGWIYWDTGNEADDSIGLTAGGTFQVAARFPASELEIYAGSYISQVEVWIADANATINVRVWEGGSLGDPGTVVYEEPFDDFEVDTWSTHVMTSSVQIQPDTEYWIGYEVTHNAGTFPAGCTTPMTQDLGGWIQFGTDPWDQIGNLGLDYNWIIHGWISGTPTAAPTAEITNDKPFEHAIIRYDANNLPGMSDMVLAPPAPRANVPKDGSPMLTNSGQAGATDATSQVVEWEATSTSRDDTDPEIRDNLLGFVIYRQEGGSGDYTELFTLNDPEAVYYDDYDVMEGELYCYKVTSLWDTGESEQVPQTGACDVPVDGMAPAPPEGLQATGNCDEETITLTWTNPYLNDNGDPLSDLYKISIYRDGQEVAQVIAENMEGQEMNYIDEDVDSADTIYEYYLTAQDYVPNESDPSNVVPMSACAPTGFVILDLDPTPTGSGVSAKILEWDPNTTVYLVNSVGNLPPVLSAMDAVFVLLGIFSNNYTLEESDVPALTEYLDSGGNMYMEGGDTWYYDTPTSLHDYFGIEGVADGSGDLSQVAGVSGTWTEGMTYSYGGENNWIDRLGPGAGSAYTVMTNPGVGYDCMVANEPGSYKTIGSSFELAGLQDGANWTLLDFVTGCMEFFEIPQVSIEDDEEQPQTLPVAFGLQQNYPNPFNPATTIAFAVKQPTHVSLKIYNTAGQLVKTLVNEEMAANNYEISWDGANESGDQVSSGVYFYVMKAGDFTAQKKMTLLK